MVKNCSLNICSLTVTSQILEEIPVPVLARPSEGYDDLADDADDLSNSSWSIGPYKESFTSSWG